MARKLLKAKNVPNMGTAPSERGTTQELYTGIGRRYAWGTAHSATLIDRQ